jgi:hypothetical protein
MSKFGIEYDDADFSPYVAGWVKEPVVRETARLLATQAGRARSGVARLAITSRLPTIQLAPLEVQGPRREKLAVPGWSSLITQSGATKATHAGLWQAEKSSAATITEIEALLYDANNQLHSAVRGHDLTTAIYAAPPETARDTLWMPAELREVLGSLGLNELSIITPEAPLR